MHAGQAERERLLAEVRRIESLLRSALAVVEEADTSSSEAPAEQAEPVQEPAREESRELRSVVQPQPEAADATPEPVAEQTQVVEDDTPGWPPLRKVAQGGHDFDWGD
jgi:hypothetical protein